jgi:hypothetical protein
VVVGGCFNAQVVCNFNGTGGADPYDGIPSETVFNNIFSPPFNGSDESVLHLFESQGPGIFAHQFTTHTPGSNDPSGSYFAVATPEPSALWLLLIGSLLLPWIKFSKTMTREEIERRMDETPAPRKIVNND